MQTIRKLDHDNTDILCHREKHLSKILGLHPLIEIDDGKLISTKKYRGSMARVVKKLAGEYALQQGLDRKEIYLIYGQGLDEALRGEISSILLI